MQIYNKRRKLLCKKNVYLYTTPDLNKRQFSVIIK
jgi:hypothetical protein